MKIIKIEHSEYKKAYDDLKPIISLHSSWTDTEENSQMTAWCLNSCEDWFLKFTTTNGTHEYYKQVKWSIA